MDLFKEPAQSSLCTVRGQGFQRGSVLPPAGRIRFTSSHIQPKHLSFHKEKLMSACFCVSDSVCWYFPTKSSHKVWNYKRPEGLLSTCCRATIPGIGISLWLPVSSDGRSRAAVALWDGLLKREELACTKRERRGAGNQSETQMKSCRTRLLPGCRLVEAYKSIHCAVIVKVFKHLDNWQFLYNYWLNLAQINGKSSNY